MEISSSNRRMLQEHVMGSLLLRNPLDEARTEIHRNHDGVQPWTRRPLDPGAIIPRVEDDCDLAGDIAAVGHSPLLRLLVPAQHRLAVHEDVDVGEEVGGAEALGLVSLVSMIIAAVDLVVHGAEGCSRHPIQTGQHSSMPRQRRLLLQGPGTGCCCKDSCDSSPHHVPTRERQLLNIIADVALHTGHRSHEFHQGCAHYLGMPRKRAAGKEIPVLRHPVSGQIGSPPDRGHYRSSHRLFFVETHQLPTISPEDAEADDVLHKISEVLPKHDLEVGLVHQSPLHWGAVADCGGHNAADIHAQTGPSLPTVLGGAVEPAPSRFFHHLPDGIDGERREHRPHHEHAVFWLPLGWSIPLVGFPRTAYLCAELIEH
mmetsp:Transcript_15316/g.33095  ORF Transcript_15316/g.33095 Transcript_15316/m.33095 type:complete len:372 (+) Transcript_15316:1598-2713(+)